jgi:hypothetical protein
MRLRLDATKGELAERGSDLLDELAKALAVDAPELANALQKASLHAHEPVLKHQALRELHGSMRSRATRGYDRMVAEILQAVDDHTIKSESPDYTAKVVAIEEAAFAKMKAALIAQGHTDEDFEEDGPLYGMSVNELCGLLKSALVKDGNAT